MRHFKVLFVFVCAALAVSADMSAAEAAAAAGAALKASALNCVKNSGLTSQQLRECCAANPTDTDILGKHKKFTHCTQRIVGIMQDDGSVHPERADILVKPEEKPRMLEIARNCLGGDTTDLDEKAFNVSVCYRQANATMYAANCNMFLDFIFS